MKARITLINGTFSYRDRDIFQQINLEVLPGEVLCILGANGCGKTTLLKCLNGSLKLGKGQVHLDDEDITRIPINEVARRIGFVFQEHSAPFPYSVIDVVSMGRGPHLGLFGRPSPKDKKIAEDALEYTGIGHLYDKPYTQISGGERQLVLIARTITQQSQVILLDEPTSHLDFKNQVLVLKMINRLAQQGYAIVMSSHFPDHAILYSSRVALMKQGAFIDVGSPDIVMTPENLETVYDMPVKILIAKDPVTGDNVRFCVPSTENAKSIWSL